MAKHNWAPKEEKQLWELKRQGISTKEIIKKIGLKGMTTNSVNTRYSELKSGRREKRWEEYSPEKNSERLVADYNGPLGKELGEYDSSNINDMLRKRQNFIYKIMADQAKKIKTRDSFLKYGGMPFSEIMRLPIEDRKDIVKMLENPKDRPDIKDIGILLTTYGPSNDFSLVLPVYISEVKNSASTKRLTSCINDSVLGVMLMDLGYEKGENLQDRFKDLAKYNFKRPIKNCGDIEARLTEKVSKEHPEIKNVYIFNDHVDRREF